MEDFKNSTNYTDINTTSVNTPSQRVILLPESVLAQQRERVEQPFSQLQPQYQPQPQPQQEPAVKEKRRARRQAKPLFAGGIRRGTAAVLLGLSILFSSTLGFVGGMAAGKFNPQQPAEQVSQSTTSADHASLIDSIKAATKPTVAAGGQALTPAQVASIAADAVVEIVTQTEVQSPSFGFFGWDMGTSIVPAAGSGVIIAENGYIITNNHVIENAKEIEVTLRNGVNYDAKLVATDAQTDVAVLKIEATGLTAAVIGDSSALVVGEPAVVIGNPLGQLGGSVTVGYISALDRQINLDGRTMNLLQTDASINRGNSGGGLFNQYGELVGIVVAKSGGDSVEGLGFAIPVNDVRGVIDDLISYGYARGRIALGVELLSIDSERVMNYYRVDKMGVYINRVNKASNAERAGLQQGDLLLQINGKDISTGEQVVEVIQSLAVGDKLSITYERAGEQRSTEIIMQETVPEDLLPTEGNY